MVYIYVLKLIKNKFYVGKTDNPKFRMQQHFNNSGSEWTKAYKPIEQVELFEGDHFDEDKTVLKYMQKYGLNNVRGGSYSTMYLQSYQKKSLIDKLNTVSNACYNCGSLTHFVKDCDESEDSDEFETDESEDSEDDIYCYRCGRKGHISTNCYARK